MASSGTAPTSTPLGEVARLIDGGDMDCGSGLLLLITRAMRRLDSGDLLAIRKVLRPVSSPTCRSGQSWSAIRSPTSWPSPQPGPGGSQCARTAPVPRVRLDRMRAPSSAPGSRTPVGQRLWAYTNFDCNLACLYCCAESSPKAEARRLDPEVVGPLFAQFREQGGKELLLTGGEPFMHPQLGELVDAAAGLERTILTNAMIFGRGRRREASRVDRPRRGDAGQPRLRQPRDPRQDARGRIVGARPRRDWFGTLTGFPGRDRRYAVRRGPGRGAGVARTSRPGRHRPGGPRHPPGRCGGLRRHRHPRVHRLARARTRSSPPTAPGGTRSR